ncbi:unnamed protein product, partial [Prorocentrum cordatum]
PAPRGARRPALQACSASHAPAPRRAPAAPAAPTGRRRGLRGGRPGPVVLPGASGGAHAERAGVRGFSRRDRLRVLHVLDRACGYDTRLEGVAELKGKVGRELSETRLSLNYPKASAGDAFSEQKADFVRRDAISHYALRIAFCKTRDARDWLVMQEQRLFVHRFEALRPEAQEACLSKFGLECRKVDPAARMGGDKGNSRKLL